MEDKKTAIHDCAKQLFVEKGFKATNISEIAKQLDIAVGTFYLYYPSKELLFMEIFLEENTKLKRRILSEIDETQEPMAAIGHMLAMNSAAFQTNPILAQWYNKKVFTKIERIYREQHGLDAVDFLYDFFLELIGKWQAQGKMRNDIEPKMIMAIFTAIINVDVHKDEIGIEYFPQILTIMTELIMGGLMGKVVQ